MAIINGRGRVGIRRPSAVVTPSIVLDGLKLYLDAGNATSYAGTGTVWTDISGNGNNGTLTGANGLPTYSSANGGSIQFDGTDDYGNLVTSSFFTGLINMTVSIWVNPQTSVNWRPIFSRYDNSTRSQGFYIFHETNNKFILDFRESAAQTYRLTTINAYSVNNWYNLTITKSANLCSIYINGTLENSATLGLGNVGWSVNSTQISALLVVSTLYYGKNRISNILGYNKALSASEVLQNYDILKSRFYPQVSDADAQSFIYAAGIQDSTQASAVNTLVTSLKSAGIWTKMKAVYPMVGGSAASHKFNLKDPRDLDAAYRLTFTTGWVHSSTGAKGNGTSDYANTFFNPSVSSNINSSHISYYARTGSNTNSVWVGSGYAGFLQSFGGTMYGSLSTGGWMSSASSNYQFAMVNRTSSNYMELRKLGVSVTSSSNLAVGYNNSIYRLNSFGNAYYSPSECAFATIGDGLTNAEATSLYTAVQAFQTSLGRQV